MGIGFLIGFVFFCFIVVIFRLIVHIEARHGNETAIEYLRNKGWRIRYNDTFPNELKPYFDKNWQKYNVFQVNLLLKKYSDARKREGDFFSLDRFLAEEEQRINRIDAKRLSTRIKRKLGIAHKANN